MGRKEPEGSGRGREFGAYVVDSLTIVNAGNSLEPFPYDRMVLCVHSHVSWKQPYEADTIVIPMLHLSELRPEIILHSWQSWSLDSGLDYSKACSLDPNAVQDYLPVFPPMTPSGCLDYFLSTSLGEDYVGVWGSVESRLGMGCMEAQTCVPVLLSYLCKESVYTHC